MQTKANSRERLPIEFNLEPEHARDMIKIGPLKPSCSLCRSMDFEAFVVHSSPAVVRLLAGTVIRKLQNDRRR